MADSYEVALSDAAKEDIEESGDPEQLFGKIEELETAPAKRGDPLRDELAGLYSIRTGDHRIIYEIDEEAPRQSHLGPKPDGAPIQGGVFVLPRALSPAPFGQFR